MQKKISLTEIAVTFEKIRKESVFFYMIVLDGKLDSANISAVTREFDRLFAEETLNTLIDMANLSYVNSTGLSLLLSLWKKINNQKKQIIFYNLHPFMRDLFNMTDLDSKFIIKNEYEDAVKCLEE